MCLLVFSKKYHCASPKSLLPSQRQLFHFWSRTVECLQLCGDASIKHTRYKTRCSVCPKSVAYCNGDSLLHVIVTTFLVKKTSTSHLWHTTDIYGGTLGNHIFSFCDERFCRHTHLKLHFSTGLTESEWTSKFLQDFFSTNILDSTGKLKWITYIYFYIIGYRIFRRIKRVGLYREFILVTCINLQFIYRNRVKKDSPFGMNLWPTNRQQKGNFRILSTV